MFTTLIGSGVSGNQKQLKFKVRKAEDVVDSHLFTKFGTNLLGGYGKKNTFFTDGRATDTRAKNIRRDAKMVTLYILTKLFTVPVMRT